VVKHVLSLVTLFALTLLLWLNPDWVGLVTDSLGISPLLALTIVCLIYSLILMMPFMPGIEIGIMIMLLFGQAGVVGAWLATVVGLSLAFLLGAYFKRSAPLQKLLGGLDQLKQPTVEPSWRQEWLSYGASLMASHPYLSVALLINIPGNMLIGGGGGIALCAGALSTMQVHRFALTVALASSLIPFLMLTGLLNL
jgi:hypothetical protein